MPLINLTLEHGRTLEEARRHLETAVNQISNQFGSVVWRVDWEADRSRVKLEGVGFWLEMSVDAQVVHATGDVPILGGILGSSLASGLKQILQLTFQKKLPGVKSWMIHSRLLLPVARVQDGSRIVLNLRKVEPRAFEER